MKKLLFLFLLALCSLQVFGQIQMPKTPFKPQLTAGFNLVAGVSGGTMFETSVGVQLTPKSNLALSVAAGLDAIDWRIAYDYKVLSGRKFSLHTGVALYQRKWEADYWSNKRSYSGYQRDNALEFSVMGQYKFTDQTSLRFGISPSVSRDYGGGINLNDIRLSVGVKHTFARRK